MALMSERAREARNAYKRAYMREYRKKNREKLAEAEERYWLRKADEMEVRAAAEKENQ